MENGARILLKMGRRNLLAGDGKENVSVVGVLERSALFGDVFKSEGKDRAGCGGLQWMEAASRSEPRKMTLSQLHFDRRASGIGLGFQTASLDSSHYATSLDTGYYTKWPILRNEKKLKSL